MKHTPFNVVATAALALLVGACASRGGLSDAQELALYRGHAGDEVSSFQYFGSINGWTPLGDEAIAVWTRPNQAWLLDLYGPCQDLPYTTAIALTNQMGRVSARFDKVLTIGRGSIQIPCTIRTIRPLDVKAIRQAEKTARDQPAQSAQPAAEPSSDGT